MVVDGSVIITASVISVCIGILIGGLAAEGDQRKPHKVKERSR